MKKSVGFFLSACLLAALLMPGAALADGGLSAITGNTSLKISPDGEKGTSALNTSCTTEGHTSGIRWASTDKSVATVSESGVVTAQGPGTADIWAACRDDDPNERTHVTVTVTQEKGSTSVGISGADELEVGEQKVYEAVAAPYSSGSYSWSAGSGLSIVSGDGTNKVTVKGTSEGSGTLSVTFTPSNPNYDPSTGSKTVTVKKAPAAPTSISFTSVPDTINVGEQKTVKVEVTPSVEGSYGWTAGAGLSILSGNGTDTVVIQGESAGDATLKVVFTPTDSSYMGCDVAKEISVKEVVVDPKLTISASATYFEEAGVTASVTSKITNPGEGTWEFSAQLASGDSVKLNSITMDGTVSFTTKSDGTSVIQVNARNVTQGRTLKAQVSVKVSLPQPFLTLSADHTHLSSSRTSTKVHANLYNANAEVPSNARIYWYSSDTSVAKITASAKYLSGSYANATVSARGNGSAIITARTANGHVVDTVRIIVENYKAIPQTGPRMWMIFAEAAVMLGLVAAAGALYYGKKKQRN